MTESTTKTRPHRPDYRVSAILPRSTGKAYFADIGAAWTNRDGSINVKLELIPTDANVTLHLRAAGDPAGDGRAEDASAHLTV